MTKGAVTRSTRRPATNVVVFQCPCGTRPIKREPRRAAPAPASHVGRRAGLVKKHQTQRGSSCGWRVFHTTAAPPPRRRVAARRRARFFLKLMPCRSKNRQTELTPTRTPRSPSNPRISSKVRSARSPISANTSRCAASAASGCAPSATWPQLCRLPPAANPGGRRRLADTQSATRPARENPSSTARMTRIRRSLEYALGMPSPNSIYGPICTQSTTSGILKTAKFELHPNRKPL